LTTIEVTTRMTLINTKMALLVKNLAIVPPAAYSPGGMQLWQHFGGQKLQLIQKKAESSRKRVKIAKIKGHINW